MNYRRESLEEQLQRIPPIVDGDFSKTVMSRILERQRRRRQILTGVWALVAILTLLAIATRLPTWASQLHQIWTFWAAFAEQVAQHMANASVQTPWQVIFRFLEQSSVLMIIAGLLAAALAATYAALRE